MHQKHNTMNDMFHVKLTDSYVQFLQPSKQHTFSHLEYGLDPVRISSQLRLKRLMLLMLGLQTHTNTQKVGTD